LISSHRKLLLSKAMVVSVAETPLSTLPAGILFRQGADLRERRERPRRCRAAEQCDELAAFHCRFLPCF
jgi:hypothetical protein